MIPPHILETLTNANPEAQLVDGYEEAFIGIAYRVGETPIAAYDYGKCIRILADREGMTPGEAKEFFEFNVTGSWVGEGTPVFVEVEEE